MNKAIAICGAAVLLAWGLGANSDGVKIGVVDLDLAVSSTDEGKAAREEFERKTREAQAKLQPLAERLQELTEELKAKQFVLSEDALRAKQLDIASLERQYKNDAQGMQGQLEVERERLVGPLRTKLSNIVEQIGREQGFSLILLRNSPGLMYAREALDVTDIVIEKFNKKG